MARVVITDTGFPDFEVERSVLEPAGFSVTRIEPGCRTEDDVIEKCRGAEVLLVQWAPITRRVLEAMPEVKCIVRYGIGVNNFDLDAARDLGVVACNVPHFCIDEVSTTAVAMILSLCRFIPQDNYRMAHGGWAPTEFTLPRSISDLALGLLGFGNISRAVAKKAACFGFSIAAYDPYVKDEVFASAGVKKLGFDELIGGSDVISIHVPLVKETTHLIDAGVIAKMKDGVMLVNTARGPIVKEDDLIAALDSGKIASAALDVFETEPLAADSPLRNRPNVILAPHSSSASDKAMVILQRSPAESALEYLRGEKPKFALVWPGK